MKIEQELFPRGSPKVVHHGNVGQRFFLRLSHRLSLRYSRHFIDYDRNLAVNQKHSFSWNTTKSISQSYARNFFLSLFGRVSPPTFSSFLLQWKCMVDLYLFCREWRERMANGIVVCCPWLHSRSKLAFHLEIIRSNLIYTFCSMQRSRFTLFHCKIP